MARSPRPPPPITPSNFVWSNGQTTEDISNLSAGSYSVNITDGNGNVEEIRGPGVLGKQPFLKSGEQYEYTSYCPLPTDFGVMHGYFEMITENGRKFNAKISPFRLTTPHSVN